MHIIPKCMCSYQQKPREWKVNLWNARNHFHWAWEMQIKSTMRYYLTFVGMVIIITKDKSMGKNVEKLELLCLVGGNGKWYSHYEKYRGTSKDNNGAIIWSSNPISGNTTKRTEIMIKELSVLTHSLQEHSQWPTYRNNSNIYWQMNG